MLQEILQKKGIFAGVDLQEICAHGIVKTAKENIQPASIDLTLSDTAYRLRASFLPGKKNKISEILESDMVIQKFSIENGAVLEKNCLYLIKLNEYINFPENVKAIANPKSSIGRIDCFVRLLCDNGELFDYVPHNYKGEIYAEIMPRAFSIIVHPGISLNQIRLYNKRSAKLFYNNPFLNLDCKDDQQEKEQANIVYNNFLKGNQEHYIHLDLTSNNNEPVAYMARNYAGIIDLKKLYHYKIEDFWHPIPACDKLILDPDCFYIMKSKESIAVWHDQAAEMSPIEPNFGEYRVHYAGFFDPGFGVGEDKQIIPSRGVMEVRSLDRPFCIYNGQKIAKMHLENLSCKVKVAYGKHINSNYQGQSLRLSKHFIDCTNQKNFNFNFA